MRKILSILTLVAVLLGWASAEDLLEAVRKLNLGYEGFRLGYSVTEEALKGFERLKEAHQGVKRFKKGSLVVAVSEKGNVVLAVYEEVNEREEKDLKRKLYARFGEPSLEVHGHIFWVYDSLGKVPSLYDEKGELKSHSEFLAMVKFIKEKKGAYVVLFSPGLIKRYAEISSKTHGR